MKEMLLEKPLEILLYSDRWAWGLDRKRSIFIACVQLSGLSSIGLPSALTLNSCDFFDLKNSVCFPLDLHWLAL